jgi:hypothetical protein
VLEKREVGFNKDDSKKVGRFVISLHRVFFLYGVTYESSARHTPVLKNEK